MSKEYLNNNYYYILVCIYYNVYRTFNWVSILFCVFVLDVYVESLWTFVLARMSDVCMLCSIFGHETITSHKCMTQHTTIWRWRTDCCVWIRRSRPLRMCWRCWRCEGESKRDAHWQWVADWEWGTGRERFLLRVTLWEGLIDGNWLCQCDWEWHSWRVTFLTPSLIGTTERGKQWEAWSDSDSSHCRWVGRGCGWLHHWLLSHLTQFIPNSLNLSCFDVLLLLLYDSFYTDIMLLG